VACKHSGVDARNAASKGTDGRPGMPARRDSGTAGGQDFGARSRYDRAARGLGSTNRRLDLGADAPKQSQKTGTAPTTRIEAPNPAVVAPGNQLKQEREDQRALSISRESGYKAATHNMSQGTARDDGWSPTSIGTQKITMAS